jgi:hypothetical protein
MSQNRKAPAYQEYAAEMLARIEYRIAPLPARGLLDTMRRECWVNKRLPECHDLLAKVLGVTEQEIDDYLPAVMFHFEVSEGFIFCPELEDYRKYLAERKEKLSKSGKEGADITNKKKKDAKNSINNNSTATPSATPSGSSRGLSTDKLSQDKQSQNQSLERGTAVIDSFIADMEAEEERIDTSSRTKVTI